MYHNAPTRRRTDPCQRPPNRFLARRTRFAGSVPDVAIGVAIIAFIAGALL